MLKPVGAKTVTEYLNMISEPRKSEVKKIYQFIKKTIPDLKPCFISNMIGFQKVAYKTKSGCTGDWFLVGLASQKSYISVYACIAQNGQYLAEKYKTDLGKVSIGKSCIRFKKVDDINLKTLEKLLKESASIYKKKGQEIFQFN